jgi:hypothetical protein
VNSSPYFRAKIAYRRLYSALVGSTILIWL